MRGRIGNAEYDKRQRGRCVDLRLLGLYQHLLKLRNDLHVIGGIAVSQMRLHDDEHHLKPRSVEDG